MLRYVVCKKKKKKVSDNMLKTEKLCKFALHKLSGRNRSYDKVVEQAYLRALRTKGQLNAQNRGKKRRHVGLIVDLLENVNKYG